MRSTGRWTSTRQPGTVTCQRMARLRHRRRPPRVRRLASRRASAPRSRGSSGCARSSVVGHVHAEQTLDGQRALSVEFALGVRDAGSSRRWARAAGPRRWLRAAASARSMASSRAGQIGAALEAVRGFGAEAEPLARRAHRCGLNHALSNTICASSLADTSESAPPMTPPIAWARSASAMTSMSGSSVRCLPSSVVSVSPGRARRTTIAGPASFAQIERVHRLAELEQHVVGDVDDVADRADAAGGQARLHPVGRRTDRHIGDRGDVARSRDPDRRW